MTIKKLKTAHAAGIAAAKKNAELFAELHPDDCGSCGGSVVLIAFGRKRKIKQLFMDAGLISVDGDWHVYGKKHYIIRVDGWQKANYNQQNASYKEMALREYITTIDTLLSEHKLDLFLHTWSD